MRHIAYIIPGYGESYLHQRSYKKIAQFFIAKNIEPIFVTIDWHKNNPADFSDYLVQFLQQYKKPKDCVVTVFGFSFGAMIALLTASKTKADNLVLCSLSPYFSEDIPSLKPAWIKWFRESFSKNDYSFSTTAAKIESRCLILVGDTEGDECMKRARHAKKILKNSTLSIVKDGKHNIYQKEYLAVIEQSINKLKRSNNDARP